MPNRVISKYTVLLDQKRFCLSYNTFALSEFVSRVNIQLSMANAGYL